MSAKGLGQAEIRTLSELIDVATYRRDSTSDDVIPGRVWTAHEVVVPPLVAAHFPVVNEPGVAVVDDLYASTTGTVVRGERPVRAAWFYRRESRVDAPDIYTGVGYVLTGKLAGRLVLEGRFASWNGQESWMDETSSAIDRYDSGEITLEELAEITIAESRTTAARMNEDLELSRNLGMFALEPTEVRQVIGFLRQALGLQ